MSVRVRLTRVGSKKNPIWRVVVADQRSPRDGRFIETIGHYNPQTEPSTIRIDEERLQHWLARGAQPSGTVKQLVKAYAQQRRRRRRAERSRSPPSPLLRPTPARAPPRPPTAGERGARRRRAAEADPEAAAAEPEADGAAESPRPASRRRAPWRTCSSTSPGRSSTSRTRSAVEGFDEDDGTIVLELHVAEDDAGKVIGRGGRTVAALRTVMKAAAVRDGHRVLVDVVD